MKKILLMAGVLAMVIAVFAIPDEPEELLEGEFIQNGNLEISNSAHSKHHVIYPEIFSTLPAVTIKLVTGRGNLEIIEQRTDGFIFKSSNLGYSVAEGAHIAWVATGLDDKHMKIVE